MDIQGFENYKGFPFTESQIESIQIERNQKGSYNGTIIAILKKDGTKVKVNFKDFKINARLENEYEEYKIEKSTLTIGLDCYDPVDMSIENITPPMEMTISEIERLLNRKIKIVG